jgi:hypothetical protein
MKPFMVLFVTLVAMCQAVRPWETDIAPGPLKDGMAIKGYINWSMSRDPVEKVVVKIDTVYVYDEPFALVTVTVFLSDYDSVNLSMMTGFGVLSNPEIMISDTTYLKETKE